MKTLSIVALVTCALPAGVVAQEEVRFAGQRWAARGELKVERHLGAEALRMRNASAELAGVDFASGTIEFDMATAGPRSFVGIAFHVQEGRPDYEHFYLRPHQTGRFDALQYTPVFNGISAWQLYPEYNTAVDIPTDQWIHLRLDVDGSRLTVHVGGQPEPTAVIEHLEGGWQGGRVVLLANFPEGGPADFFPTAFANFEIRPAPATASAEAERQSSPASGAVTAWAVSPSFVAAELPLESVPDSVIPVESWTVVPAEPSGRVNLARYRAIPTGAQIGTVLARVIVRSERERIAKLNFGFSDRASVFLNRQVIFTGNNTYRSRSMRYLGVMTVDNDALYLPLRRGENELIVAVSEAFGGWGLTARFANLDGISVDAPRP